MSIGEDLTSSPWFNDVLVNPQDPAVVLAATPWGLYRTRRVFDTHVSSESAAQPRGLALAQNYPNPFNSGTTIRFTVEGSQHASLKIYNVLGQQVRTLLDEEIEGGVHSEIWNGRNARGEPVGTGVYFCRLSAGDMRATIRLLSLR